jgi:predicted double-glycine peptidase
VIRRSEVFTIVLLATSACGAATPLLPVPLVRQANSYSCGAAALTSVLYYYRRFDGRETELYERLTTTEADGTHPASIVAVARQFGLTAELREGVTVGDVRAAVERRDAVIVDLQAWTDAPHPRWRDEWEDGHYVVAVGIDATRLYVMDPSTPGAYAFVALSELPDRWHDYETLNGARREYHHMAIFFRGTGAAMAYPQPTSEMR